MFKEKCIVTGKVIRGSTIDEFQENWAKHLEEVNKPITATEVKVDKPKKVIEVKAKIDKIKQVKKKVTKKKK